MKRRKFNVFSLSFLDIITCGLGSIILLFVLVNAKSASHRDRVSAELRAEATKLEEQVLDAKKQRVLIRNTLEEMDAKIISTQGLSRQVIRTIKENKVELSDRQKDTLAATEHINKLKADIKSIEDDIKRLKAGAKTQDDLGTRLRPFPGQGDRQYLTDLKMGGHRIFILVDTSASMLDETIVGIIRRRNLDDTQKLHSPKWRQVIDSVDWLTTQIPPTSKFQVYTFNETAQALLAGTRGTWLDAGDIDILNKTVERIRNVVPEKGTSLLNAFSAIQDVQPAPDNIFLLIDSLPTMGANKPLGKRVSGKKRFALFEQARVRLPAGVPVNIILYPMEGDPLAASAYWRLAKDTRGSFFCPARDWP